MPRIQRGAERVPVKPQSVLYALLMTAGLTLSGCGTATPDRMGSGGEVDAPGGEPGQVVEVISSDPEAASQPAEPEATAEATADARGESLAALRRRRASGNTAPRTACSMSCSIRTAAATR
jgi:hypothetical protein